MLVHCVPLCLMWLLWQERNSHPFDDVKILEEKLRLLFHRLPFE